MTTRAEAVQNFEDDLLKGNKLGVDDEDDVEGAEGEEEEEEEGGEADDGEGGDTAPPVKEPPANTKQPADKGNKGDGKGKPGEKGKAPPGPKPLLDPKTGQPIAQGGVERRLFEKFKHTATVDLPKVQAQLDAYKEASNFTKYDLTPAEATQGYALVKALKADPVKVIKHLLTQAQAAGHTVDIGTGGTLDMAAIKQMVDGATAPLREAGERQRKETEATERATKEYGDFIDRFPDAALHEQAIAEMISREKDITLPEAYYKLKAFYAENKFDWNKPLRQIVTEMQAAKTKQQGRKGGANPPPRMITGRGAESMEVGETLRNVQEDDDETMAPASASNSDIIRSAMKKHGYFKN